MKADLSDADLTGAGLKGASLQGADLSGTTLRGADLSGAKLDGTVLNGSKLGEAKGLEAVEHQGPSQIDERTLLASGRLPTSFLRGCGLSDRMIEYLPSLLNEAIEFYSCFISHSAKDHAFAERLHTDLQDKGVRCWFAPESLKIGDHLRVRIDESIRLYDKLLIILSKHSVESQWVEQEVETALDKERRASKRGEDRTVLFPIRLDDAVMKSDAGWAAYIRRTRHIGDFTRWKDHDAYQQAFERLLRDLKAGERVEPWAT